MMKWHPLKGGIKSDKKTNKKKAYDVSLGDKGFFFLEFSRNYRKISVIQILVENYKK